MSVQPAFTLYGCYNPRRVNGVSIEEQFRGIRMSKEVWAVLLPWVIVGL